MAKTKKPATRRSRDSYERKLIRKNGGCVLDKVVVPDRDNRNRWLEYLFRAGCIDNRAEMLFATEEAIAAWTTAYIYKTLNPHFDRDPPPQPRPCDRGKTPEVTWTLPEPPDELADDDGAGEGVSDDERAAGAKHFHHQVDKVVEDVDEGTVKVTRDEEASGTPEAEDEVEEEGDPGLLDNPEKL
jgi:hypothetical protein